VLDRSPRRHARSPQRRVRAGQPAGQLLLDLGTSGDGFGELVPPGQLRELTAAERVEAELDILGIDLSQHVLSFYDGLLAELGVVRSRALARCRPGAWVLVAGVKIATQTPAVRSGQRVIFASLDDTTGPVDLVFFESVQDRCAARVFGSWLLVVAGRVRRVGRSVSITGAECWDLAALAEIRAAAGIGAVREAMAAGDVPAAPGPASRDSAGAGTGPGVLRFASGFTQSPYAETGSPGGSPKDPPRKLWHASPGSSGGWAGPRRPGLSPYCGISAPGDRTAGARGVVVPADGWCTACACLPCSGEDQWQQWPARAQPMANMVEWRSRRDWVRRSSHRQQPAAARGSLSPRSAPRDEPEPQVWQACSQWAPVLSGLSG
jgi:hypothetical protein